MLSLLLLPYDGCKNLSKPVSNSIFYFNSLSLSEFAALVIVLVPGVICFKPHATLFANPTKQQLNRTKKGLEYFRIA